MPVPPDPILRAAVRWLERLPTTGRTRCRALFTTLAEFSDITPTQYDAALAWITETGLLDDLHSIVPVQQQVFDATLLSGGTHWLADADLLVRSPSELPEDAVRAAEALDIGKDQAYRQLKAVWSKVDAAERARIGAEGEAALVELLTASTVARIEHVAAFSDAYGYDIAVHANQRSLHVEVKTTMRRNRLTLFLSRNEFETMLTDSSWQLVVVRLSTDRQITAVGTVTRNWICSQVPTDRGPYGRWESCRLETPITEVTPGIPQLKPDFLQHPSPLLEGAAGWTA